jgi:predicted ATPase
MIGGMPARASSPVLVGRTAEVERLREVLATVRTGQAATVLIGGEAGVGKTRLATELAAEARSQGATVLLGGCIVLGDGALPFAPIAEALRGLAREVDPAELDVLLGQARPELARLVPDLSPADPGVAPAAADGSGQGRLFELLLGVLGRLAARTPLVLILRRPALVRPVDA